MTRNQIAYWESLTNRDKLDEQRRSNLANERETHRSNTAKEGETARSNRASEAISWANIAESVRHNQAQEKIGESQAQASLQQAAVASRNADTNAVNAETKRMDSYIDVAELKQTRIRDQNKLDMDTWKYVNDSIRLLPVLG